MYVMTPARRASATAYPKMVLTTEPRLILT
jgi:hypothetical protein